MPRRHHWPVLTLALLLFLAMTGGGTAIAQDVSPSNEIAADALWRSAFMGLGAVSAQQAGGVLTIGSATVDLGEQAMLELRVSNVDEPGLSSYQLKLTFNPSVMKILQIRAGDAPFDSPQLTGTLFDANQQGSVNFGQFVSEDQAIQNGVIAQLVVESVGDDAGTTTLSGTLANNSCACVTVQNGTFEVNEPPDTGDDDDDGLPNDEEDDHGTDPTDPDTDDDGLNDGDEVDNGTDPTNPDSDFDGVDDGDEIDQGTDPTNPDTDDDGLTDRDDACPTEPAPEMDDGCPEEEDVGGDPPIFGNIQVFPTPEPAMGQDLDRNGEMRGSVLRFRDINTGEIVNTGLSVSDRHADVDLYEDTLAFISGDGQLWTYDVASRTSRNLAVQASHPSVHGSTLTFESSGWVRYIDLRTGERADPKVQGREPVVFGNRIAFRAGSTPTIQIYNTSTGTLNDTGVVGTHPAIYGDTIAFETRERDVGKDLNGNGTIDGVSVIRTLDLSTGRVTNTATVGRYPIMWGDRVAFATAEATIDDDLNGDGQVIGSVIRVYDMASDRIINTEQLGTEPDIYQGTLSSYRWERWTNDDLNRDGDTSDPIVQSYRLTGAEPSAPRQAPTMNTPSTSEPGLARFDANGNGVIDDPEFLDGLDRWVDGELSDGTLFELMDAWIAGTRVSSATAGPQPLTIEALTVSSRSDRIVFAAQGADVRSLQVSIFDAGGERVFHDRSLSGRLAWSKTTSAGERLANGVYFYTVKMTDAFGNSVRTEVHRLVLLR